MKKIIIPFVFCFLCKTCFSQAGMWAWIKGPNTINSPGVYGTQGVADPLNIPPAVYEPCEWIDFSGNFWLFGGLNSSNGRLGDLWKYEPGTNNWTWMKGTGTANHAGSFGVQGVPSLSNLPPGRSFGAATWVDLNGDLWLFGGAISGGSLNDLWKYNIATNTWTWMKGATTIATSFAVWGTQGVPSQANTPRWKNECSGNWVDSAGNLWIYGGFNNNYLNDMWKYNPGTNEWTWMDGDSLINVPRNCGIKGVPSPANEPGGRQTHCSWKDANGNFWLFGAEASIGGFVYYNDMWMYDVSANTWTWMSGTDIGNDAGNYGALCTPSANYCPSARKETRARWTDTCGKFWLYGGGYNDSYNDLWQFDPSTLKWQLLNGGAIGNLPPDYGTLGVAAPNVQPGGKGGAVGWRNADNEIYLFGGHIPGSTVNSMWKFYPDTNCNGCPINTGMVENNFSTSLFVFPNPVNSSLAISFQSSGKQTVELHLYNTLGKQTYFSKEQTSSGKFEKEINVEKWSDGIYFLQVKMMDGMVNKKVVVQH